MFRFVIINSIAFLFILSSCTKKMTIHSIQKDNSPKIDSAQKTSSTSSETEISNSLETKWEELDEDDLNKATFYLSSNDSILTLTAQMRIDHRIFGYAKPDTTSERLILFSIFTNEVENNPSKCKFGSYYSIENDQPFKIKYVGNKDEFVETKLIHENGTKQSVFFEKKWIDFR